MTDRAERPRPDVDGVAPREPAPKMTAADVREALHRRYTAKNAEQYVCIEEARSGAGFAGNNGQCDFLAINTWQSRGLELIGHEVKVSMSDWKAELAQPEKAERFARYCRRWYVAVPSDLAAKIKHEVPPAWGLLAVTANGVREVVKPEARNPETVPAWWWVGWLAQIDRQHKRDAGRKVQQMIAQERTKLTEQVEAEVKRRRAHAEERDERLRENAKKLKAAVGIDVEYLWDGNIDRLRQAWGLVQSAFDVEHLARTLRRTADALDELTAPAESEAVSSAAEATA